MALGLPLAAASCGLPKRARSMFGGDLPLQVTVSPQANHDSPIAVELVIAYDDKVLDELLKTPAGDWFRKREQLRRDYAGQLETWKWEWVPGQEVAAVEVSYRLGAKGAVLFADYLTPGEHRARLDPHRPLRLLLGETDFKLVEAP
ncbi:MAG TPA: type VI secretion protein [Thermoanaerobaculia bacterium]|nr:type VI secretion protein [Thermoanaerobaculia bacterium]